RVPWPSSPTGAIISPSHWRLSRRAAARECIFITILPCPSFCVERSPCNVLHMLTQANFWCGSESGGPLGQAPGEKIIREKSNGRITIRTVAADAGVSVAAVSKVLRDAYGVSDEMRQKVNGAIAKLGYRPSKPARGLRGRTFTIGILLVD